MTNNLPKEIEYGVKVKNSKELLAYLNTHGANKGQIETVREIYKKKNSPHFFRTDKQVINKKMSYMFSIKEDILGKKGVSKGLKVSDEVDLEVTKKQLEKLKQMLMLQDYHLVTTISKIRRIFDLQNLMVTLDSYPDVDYLEVEGDNKEKIMKLVSQLPIVELKMS